MKKKVLAVILSTLLCIGVMPAGVMAAEEAAGDFEIIPAVTESDMTDGTEQTSKEETGRTKDVFAQYDTELESEEAAGEAAGAAFNPYVFSEDGGSARVALRPELMGQDETAENPNEVSDEDFISAGNAEILGGGDELTQEEAELIRKKLEISSASVQVLNLTQPSNDENGGLRLKVVIDSPELTYDEGLRDMEINATVIHKNTDSTLTNATVKFSTVALSSIWDGTGEQPESQIYYENGKAVAALYIPVVKEIQVSEGWANGVCLNDNLLISIFGTAFVKGKWILGEPSSPVMFEVDEASNGETFEQIIPPDPFLDARPHDLKVDIKNYYLTRINNSKVRIMNASLSWKGILTNCSFNVSSYVKVGDSFWPLRNNVNLTKTLLSSDDLSCLVENYTATYLYDDYAIRLIDDSSVKQFDENGIANGVKAGQELVITVNLASNNGTLVVRAPVPFNGTFQPDYWDTNAILTVPMEEPVPLETPELKSAVIRREALNSPNYVVEAEFANPVIGADEVEILVLSGSKVEGTDLNATIKGKTYYVRAIAEPVKTADLFNGTAVRQLKFFGEAPPEAGEVLYVAARGIKSSQTGDVQMTEFGDPVKTATEYQIPVLESVAYDSKSGNITAVFSSIGSGVDSVMVFMLSKEDHKTGQNHTIDGNTYFEFGMGDSVSGTMINMTRLDGKPVQVLKTHVKSYEGSVLKPGDQVFFVARNYYQSGSGLKTDSLISEISSLVETIASCDPPVLENAAYGAPGSSKMVNATAVFKTEDLDADWFELYLYSKKDTGHGNKTIAGEIYYDLGIQSFSPGGSSGINSTGPIAEVDKKAGKVTLRTSNVYFYGDNPPALGETVYIAVETANGRGISNLIELVVGKDTKPAAPSMFNATITLNPKSYKYTGSAIKPKPVVKYDGKTLKSGTDYTLSYKNNKNVGPKTAQIIIKGIGKYTDSATYNFTIVKATDTITAKDVTKTASTKKQSFSLGAKTIGGTMTYKSSSKSVTVDKKGKVTVAANYIGEATITITSAATKNCKKSTKKVTVTVNPAKPTLSSVTNIAPKSVKAVWKKPAVTAITGYQIWCSTDKNFKKSVKKLSVKGYKTLTKTISKLTKNKTYYVKVRAYKTVSKKTYYSAWSAVKSAKIKK